MSCRIGRHGPGPGSNEPDGRSRIQKRRIRRDDRFSYIAVHGWRAVQGEQALTSHYGKHRMDLMQHKFVAIILFLVFALLVQNTCPRGFAGRSTVFASCSHCPHKQMLKSPVETRPGIISHGSVHLPLFVLEMPESQPALRLVSAPCPQPVIPNNYKNAFPDELLRPPQA